VSESAQKNQDHLAINVMGLNSDVWIAEGVDCDKVIVDDFDSARNATQHLIDLVQKYCFDILNW
jgi:LacI family transcriptional regulator